MYFRNDIYRKCGFMLGWSSVIEICLAAKLRLTIYYVSGARLGVRVQDNAASFTYLHSEYDVDNDVAVRVLVDVNRAIGLNL